jgi:hypothetical protein
MRSMSFAYTVQAFLSGEKSVTRRDWNDNYAVKFAKGDQLKALDRSPMFGGKIMAIIELTKDPYKEHISKMPVSHYRLEGFKWMEDNGVKFRSKEPRQAWLEWKKEDKEYWVVHFKIVEFTDYIPRKGIR